MSYLNNHPSWETRQQREERQEIKEPEVSEKVIQKFTRSELIDMTKEEQTIIIRELDPKLKIPRYESDRVNLILKLQK